MGRIKFKFQMSGDKPKRPLSGYFRYLATIRATVKEENPDMAYTDQVKVCGTMWLELPQEEKDAFNKKYEEELQPYKDKLSAWEEKNPDHKELAKEKRATKKEAREERAGKVSKREKSKATKEQRKDEDKSDSEKEKKAKGKKPADKSKDTVSGKDKSKDTAADKDKSKVAAKKSKKETEVFQFKILLKGVVKPPVWRRIQVKQTATFADMHPAILNSMGWGGGHLHMFRMKDPADPTNRQNYV